MKFVVDSVAITLGNKTLHSVAVDSVAIAVGNKTLTVNRR